MLKRNTITPTSTPRVYIYIFAYWWTSKPHDCAMTRTRSIEACYQQVRRVQISIFPDRVHLSS